MQVCWEAKIVATMSHARVYGTCPKHKRPPIHTRRRHASSVVCQAASAAPSTLPARVGVIPFRLLQDALPTLVRSLSQAPLLLLTSAPGKEQVVSIPRTIDASDSKVSERGVGDGTRVPAVTNHTILGHTTTMCPHTQTWEHYAALLRQENPSLYIFAEEVVCGGDNCVLNRPSTPHDMQSLSPIPTTTQCAEELRDENAPRFSGRLGDCCEEEDAAGEAAPAMPPPSAAASPINNIVPLLAAQHQQQRHNGARCSHEPSPTATRSSVRFWGLVVRAANHTDPVEGCYLLKTTENSDPTGCTCVHYSLTKVKRGESLYQQLVQSWLV